jgi:hypothetical protein
MRETLSLTRSFLIKCPDIIAKIIADFPAFFIDLFEQEIVRRAKDDCLPGAAARALNQPDYFFKQLVEFRP